MGRSAEEVESQLIAVSALMLMPAVYFLFLNIASDEVRMFPEALLRLTLLVALLWYLCKGCGWARLTLAFFALTGVAYLTVRLIFFYHGSDIHDVILMVIKDAVYIASVSLLTLSNDIKEYMAPSL